jgi:2'-5' RNA ligase
MRLFVALDLPDVAKDALAAVAGGVTASVPGARWVPRDNLHLTLVFLGGVDDARVPELSAALITAAKTAAPFTARLGRAGAFPSRRRARVLWIGMEDDAGALTRLAEATAAALEPLGFERERRAWTAHLTLARFRTPCDLSSSPPIEVSPLSFEVRELSLFRSRLGRPTPVYEPLARFPLGG